MCIRDRASEPFYALRDGKLVLLRTKPIDVTGAMPESYLRVLRQARGDEKRGDHGYRREDRKYRKNNNRLFLSNGKQ